MTVRRVEVLLFRVFPAVVLAIAFVGICQVAGTAWPWNVVVHEDGVRTLLQTLFFFEHGTRELVPDIVLAAAVAGAVRYYYPPDGSTNPPGTGRAARRALIGILVLILAGTWWEGDWHAVVDNLLQQHTRSGEPLVWGAHWRYHLIERIGQMWLAFAVVGGVSWTESRARSPQDTGHRPQGAGSARWYLGTLAAFAVLTIVFRLTSEPFTDPRFLGHQARELFTHTLVTLPLALGACLTIAHRVRGPAGSASRPARWPIGITLAGAILCGAFLLVASVASGAQSHGQSDSLAALIFPHFAEHAMGYVLVPSLSVVLYLAGARQSRAA